GGPRLIPDAVHPSWAGHLVMATHILKGLGAPRLVSSVEIDVTAPNSYRLTSSQNALIAWRGSVLSQPQNLLVGPVFINKNSPNLSFVRTDGALPWPIHPDTKLALDIPNFKPLDELSRYELKVTNLPQSKYEISIDDQSIGTFSREQLSAGVNLSNNAGPITVQAQQLLQKILDKNDAFNTRWRNVQIFQAPEWLKTDIETARTAELARLDAQIAAMESEIDELRKPKPHVWTLKPVI
ncbi:MAG: hypothetical protein KY445_08570, partial [Armatimonadetes bacterium]|nr:hypothetical protein [Armatimonadota bacterium]